MGTDCTADNDGDIRVNGTHSENVVAGRMELCLSGEWRAVCESGWDQNDASVVCRQLGYLLNQSGIIYVHY